MSANPAILIEQDYVYAGRGDRATITVKHPITLVGVTGLTITHRLSSTEPTLAAKGGTLIENCETTMVATATTGQYTSTLDEAVVDAAIATRNHVWRILDGPNVYQVWRLTAVKP